MKCSKFFLTTMLTIGVTAPSFCSDDMNSEYKRLRSRVVKIEPAKPKAKKSKAASMDKPVALAIFIKEKYKPLPIEKGSQVPAFFIEEAGFELGRIILTRKNKNKLGDFDEGVKILTLTDDHLKLFSGLEYTVADRKILLEVGKAVGVVPVFKDDDSLSVYARMNLSKLPYYHEIATPKPN